MSGPLDFPVTVDGRGRIAVTDADDHVRDLIAQVLFTDPGERVNRPDFGSGIRQLVFMPNSEPLAIATEFAIKGALQRWLGDVIRPESVEVTAEDATLRVTVTYRRLVDGATDQATFEHPGTS